jgi:hypothetical protein
MTILQYIRTNFVGQEERGDEGGFESKLREGGIQKTMCECDLLVQRHTIGHTPHYLSAQKAANIGEHRRDVPCTLHSRSMRAQAHTSRLPP